MEPLKYKPIQPTELLITAGTYERLLYGLTLTSSSLQPSFIYPAHISCISSVSSSKRFLATGSTDEHVKLYDLRLRKEVGALMHHNGTITCLEWVGKSHLITASQDGTIGIVRSSDWELLKTLKGHNGSVLGIDVHSSGKLLLSIGIDKTLKCWDLTRALLSYSIKLAIVPTKVKFSKTGLTFFNSGGHYLVFHDHGIQVYSLATGSLINSISSKSRINTSLTALLNLDSVDYDVVVYGGEDKILRVRTFDGKGWQWESGHGLRIKDIAICEGFVASAGSEGGIKLWNLKDCVEECIRELNGAQPALADIEVAIPEEKETTETPRALDESAVLAPEFVSKIICPITTYEAKCRLTSLSFTRSDKPTTHIIAQKESIESDWEDAVKSGIRIDGVLKGEVVNVKVKKIYKKKGGVYKKKSK